MLSSTHINSSGYWILLLQYIAATNTPFNNLPEGVFVDGDWSGNIYVTEYSNYRIRKVPSRPRGTHIDRGELWNELADIKTEYSRNKGRH